MMSDWNILEPAWANGVLGALADHALRSSVLLVGALLVTAALRRRAASVRHAIWMSVFAAVLLLPVGTWLLPDWEVLPSRSPVVSETASAAETEAFPLQRSARRPAMQSAAGSTAAGRESAGSRATPDPQPTPWVVARSVRDLAARANEVTPARWLVLAWLAGLVLGLARQANGAIQMRRITSAGVRPSDPVLALADRALARLGMRQAVDIRLSPRVPMPATRGRRSAAILLPISARHWDEDRLWHVLLHELAHVARRDHTVQTLARAVCSVFWFNPLLWLALRSLRAESEIASDDRVVLSGSTASRYAGHLVAVARSVRATSPRLPAAALAMAHPSRLEDRIRTILDPRTSRIPMKPHHALLSMAAVLLVSLPVAAAARQVIPPPRPSPSPPAPVAVPGTPAPVPSAIPAAPDPAAAPAPAPAPSPMARPVPSPAARPAVPAPAPEAQPAVPFHAPRPIAPPDTLKNRARVIAAFIAALQDPDPEMRRQAAWGLAELDASEAVEPLAGVLADDQDPEVRRTALHALGELDPDAALPAITSRFRSETEPETRREMLWVMAESGEASMLPAVQSALDDGDPGVRRDALMALAELGTPETVPLLTGALDDPDPDIQRMALHALAELAGPADVSQAALAAVVRATKSADPDVREAAIVALAEAGGDAAVPALVAATTDSEPDVRRHALWALAESDSPDAIPALARAASDADPEVRRFALYALAERDGAASFGTLVDALDDPDSEVRRAAVTALAESEHPEAADALARVLEDEDTDVRQMAIWGLAESGSADAAVTARLVAVLEGDAEPEVRQAAVHALGEIGSDAALDALTRALQDPDPDVRKAAMAALADLAGGR